YEGEAIASNYQKSFVLKVIRGRVRVLLVVGRPSWDVRFLRQLLKKDPNVDLISFFILRTPGDDPHSSQDELSLIPFPTQEIFQEQLKTFDLVIFQNFNHRPYRMSQYLDGIAAYVRDGGAFAMIGGAQTLLTSAEGRPLLVVGEAGRGRVLALLTDSSWYWSFLAAGAQLGPRAYETFWHSAIRWLVRDPALTPMRVAAERPSFEP